jgi:hypothetical protein
MSKPYRFTLTIPACATVDATGRVDPAAGAHPESRSMSNIDQRR